MPARKGFSSANDNRSTQEHKSDGSLIRNSWRFFRAGRLIEASNEPLSPRVVLRSSYIDENSMLLRCVQSVVEKLRKDLLLEAHWSFRNVIENPTIEDVYPCVHESSAIALTLLGEPTNTVSGGHL